MLALGGRAPLPVLILNLPHDEELTAQNADHDDDGEGLEVDAALPRRLRHDFPHLDWTLRLFDIITIEIDVGFEGLLMISSRDVLANLRRACASRVRRTKQFLFLFTPAATATAALPSARAQVKDPGRRRGTHRAAEQLSMHVGMWRLLGRVDL